MLLLNDTGHFLVAEVGLSLSLSVSVSVSVCAAAVAHPVPDWDVGSAAV